MHPEEPDRRWVSNVTAAALIGFSLSWAVLLFLIGRGTYGSPRAAVDIGLYAEYAQQVVAGHLPYRDFPLEYPPLVLVPILLPVLLGASPFDEAGYRQLFQFVVAAFGMVTMILIMWSVTALDRGRRDAIVAAAVVAASPLLLGPLMLNRYDIWPALFAAAGVWLLVSGRTRWAGVAIGLGILAKVYPIVIVPFALAWLWRRGDRQEATWLGATTAVTVAAGLLPFFLVAPDGIVDALTRAFRRPLQVESLGAALLYARQVLTGVPVQVVHTFDSYNLRGDAAELVGLVQNGALGLVLLATFWLFWRAEPTADRFVLAVAAALVAWVAFGRVFSPQYLIWLIAPLAIITNRRWPVALAGLVLAVALTGWYYPRFYSAFLDRADPMWVAVVLARDLVLVALAGYLIARVRTGYSDAGASTSLSTAGSGSRGLRIRRP